MTQNHDQIKNLEARFIHPDTGLFTTRIFNVAEHADRVKLTRFNVWCYHRGVEVRLAPKTAAAA